jgi:hypothetical protein
MDMPLGSRRRGRVLLGEASAEVCGLGGGWDIQIVLERLEGQQWLDGKGEGGCIGRMVAYCTYMMMDRHVLYEHND